MSAWLVSRAHIDVIVTVAARGPSGVPTDPSSAWHIPRWPDASGNFRYLDSHDNEGWSRVGGMLWAENARSIAYRYPDHPEDAPPPDQLEAVYAWKWSMMPVVDGQYIATVPEALKAIGCLSYQSCEHPEWDASEANAFLRALTASLVGHVAGYDEAPWGWDDREVAQALARQIGVLG